MHTHRLRSIFWLIVGTAGVVQAADFYVDPLNGSAAGDGSSGDPWLTLQQVIEDGLIETRHWASLPPGAGTPLIAVNAGAPVQPGDTVWLRSGYHGELVITGAYNLAPVTLAAQPGHTPRLGRIKITSAAHWVVQGVDVSSHHVNPPLNVDYLVEFVAHNHHGPAEALTLRDSAVYTRDDVSGWDADDWINLSNSGVRLGADDSVISGNVLRNLRFGISAGATGVQVAGNLIDGISADGIRGLGNDSVYEYNRVQNMYVSSSQGDGNHDDGFQSWSVGDGGVGTGQVSNVVLRGNLFINFTDPANPLNAPMQGIGCFDGQFVNWTVENNVVITNHWHGISFYGMHDSRIVNNSVIDIQPGAPGPAWIRVNPYNGIDSNNVLLRNNLAQSFVVSGSNIQQDHNLNINDPGALFVQPPLDLRLRGDAAAVDAGLADQAPDVDMLGVSRPQGPAHDVGAHEFVDRIFYDAFD